MNSTYRYFIFLIALVFLASCQTTGISGNQVSTSQPAAFHIVDVDVSLPNDAEKHQLQRYTSSFKSRLTSTITDYANEYNAALPGASKRYRLKVKVSDIYYKNGVASVVPGLSNRIKSTSSLVDLASGKVVQETPTNYVDVLSIAQSGISGVVVGVVLKKEVLEASMARGKADKIMKTFYPNVRLEPAARKRLLSKAWEKQS